MPKDIPKTTKSIALAASGRIVEILEHFRKGDLLMFFDWPKNGAIKKKQKQSSAETTRWNTTSRAKAKEGGGGEVNLPLGSKG